jgi:hypothetical protein
MTLALVHYNGSWQICRLSIFNIGGIAVPCWVSQEVTGAYFCLCGEENIARTLEDPTDREMETYARAMTAREGGIVELEKHMKKEKESGR